MTFTTRCLNRVPCFPTHRADPRGENCLSLSSRYVFTARCDRTASSANDVRRLILQVDDRPIYPVLDDNTTHSSLSMAINYHYALRHGYDYRLTQVNNDESNHNVTISANAVIKTLDELLLNAKGNIKGCFHPILGAQRSSPW